MKKLMCVFFTLTALLMLAAPAFAAGAPAARYDLPDRDGPGPAAAAYAADTPMEPVDGSGEESAYREETPSPTAPPQRQPGRGEIDDIYAYWEKNGYPDYVSYAFAAGGEMTADGTICTYWEIGLVDAGETQKQEILSLVSPDCLVEFKNCLFTHAQKQTAYDALTELAETDKNILEVIFIRNDDSVWVAVPEELTKEYAKYLIRDLGLGAVVSVTDEDSINAVTTDSFLDGAIAASGDPGIAAPGGAAGIVPEVGAGAPLWTCLILAAVFACTLTVLALHRYFAPAAVTESGTVRTTGAPLSRRQTEQAVREDMQAPSASVYRAVLERIAAENSLTEK